MSDYRRGVEEATGEVGWTLGKSIIPAILVVLFCALIGACLWGLDMASRPAQVVSKVTNADRIIYGREWFKQTLEDLKAQEQQIGAAKAALASFQKDAGPRDQWGYSEGEQERQLRQTLNGLVYARSQKVADYNARAKSETTAFLAWGMPKEVQ